MSLADSIQAALLALRGNALRSMLTMLGIIIGVASVITMVSVSSGAQKIVDSRISSLGANVLVLNTSARRVGGRSAGSGTRTPFNDGDVAALKQEISAVEAVSGIVRTQAQIVNGNLNWNAQVKGIHPDYLVVRNWLIARGQGIDDRDLATSAKVALLGQTVARELFGTADPIGQRIRIKNVPFLVIGVLGEKGESTGGGDQDDIVFVPITTARKRLAGRKSAVSRYVRYILIKAADDADLASTQTAIEELMRVRRRIPMDGADNFRLRNLQQVLEARTATQETLAILLAATAAVSLVVGGIGIMNIMLVSVTERTREIGLRLAVGARRRDILLQFLVEAVILCALGGIIGVVIGLAISLAIAHWGAWPLLVVPEVIVASVLAAGLVGIFFGFYPARKASRMNPIDALRFE